MGELVRKQIYLTSKQVRAIQKRAEAIGISQSEFIRRAIDQGLFQTSFTSRSDPSALDNIEEFIQNLNAKKPTGKPIQFNRDEIYAERLDRYGVDTN
ncbi:MAG: CopG family transcriptional regulator [Anaerolineales bacterium]|nr:CopG family transcriptional regulator [Anaerolineales bacterium]